MGEPTNNHFNTSVKLQSKSVRECYPPFTNIPRDQARHSYMFQTGSIVFNQMFAECMQRDEEGRCMVDLEVGPTVPIYKKMYIIFLIGR